MNGWTLPGYDVEELLGFGETGEVWRARDHSSGQRVAIKRLRQPSSGEDLAGPAARDRLRREGARVAGFAHPAVLPLLRVLGTSDGAALVTAYAEGGSLRPLVTAGPVSLGAVVGFAVPVAGALAAAHARGIVHGGLGAGDVLLVRSEPQGWAVQLADLGVVAMLDEVPPGAAPRDVRDLAELVVLALTGAAPGLDVADALGHALAGVGVGPREVALARGAVDDGDAAALARALALLAAPDALTPGLARGPLSSPRQETPEPPEARAAALPLRAHEGEAGEGMTRLPRPGSPRPAPARLIRPERRGRSGRGAHRARPGRSRPDRPVLPGSRRSPRWAGASSRLSELAADWWRPAVATVVALAGAAALGLAWGSSSTAPAPMPLAVPAPADQLRAPASLGPAASPEPAPVTSPAPVTAPEPATSPALPPSAQPGNPPSGGATTGPTAGGPAGAPSLSEATTPEWAALLDRLDAARAAAFAAADPALLAEVWAPGSASMRRDRDVIAALAERRWRAPGVRHELVSAQPVDRQDDRVRLRVVDRLPEVPVVDAAGNVVATQPGRATTAYTALLVRLPGGGDWRLADVGEPD